MNEALAATGLQAEHRFCDGRNGAGAPASRRCAVPAVRRGAGGRLARARDRAGTRRPAYPSARPLRRAAARSVVNHAAAGEPTACSKARRADGSSRPRASFRATLFPGGRPGRCCRRACRNPAARLRRSVASGPGAPAAASRNWAAGQGQATACGPARRWPVRTGALASGGALWTACRCSGRAGGRRCRQPAGRSVGRGARRLLSAAPRLAPGRRVAACSLISRSTTTSVGPPIRMRCSTSSRRTSTSRRWLSTAAASITASRVLRLRPPATKVPKVIERTMRTTTSTMTRTTNASSVHSTAGANSDRRCLPTSWASMPPRMSPAADVRRVNRSPQGTLPVWVAASGRPRDAAAFFQRQSPHKCGGASVARNPKFARCVAPM